MIYTSVVKNPTTPEYICQDFDWHYPNRWPNLDGTWTQNLPVVAADLDDAVEYLTDLAQECNRPIATNVPALAERLQQAGVPFVDIATAWRWS